MAIKVDLEKAYDRLKWEFVFDTLRDNWIARNFYQHGEMVYFFYFFSGALEWRGS